MTKRIAESVADAALDLIASRATHLTLCAGAPANEADATTVVSLGGNMLASSILNPASQAGFAVTSLPAGGRRLNIAGQVEIAGVENGIVDHLALVDATAGELLLLTELTEPQPVSTGEVIATRSFSLNLNAPV